MSEGRITMMLSLLELQLAHMDSSISLIAANVVQSDEDLALLEKTQEEYVRQLEDIVQQLEEFENTDKEERRNEQQNEI